MKTYAITIKLTRDEILHLIDALDKQVEFFEGFEGAADEEIGVSNSISTKLYEALDSQFDVLT